MTVGQNAPIEPLDRYAQMMNNVDRRIGELERRTSRPASASLFVRRTGDTMSGLLQIAIAAECLRMTQPGSYQSWYNGGTRIGYLQGNPGGVILNSETGRLTLQGNDGITMTPFKINGYTGTETTGAYRVVLSTANGYVYANYFNSPSSVESGWPQYVAGQNGDNFLRWYNRGAELNNGRFGSTNNSNQWSTCGLSSTPGAGWAAMSLHCGGVAPVFGAGNGYGNNVYIRDAAFTAATAALICQAFVQESSRRYKKNITSWPLLAGGAATPRASDMIARLRPVTFERDDYIDGEIPTGRRLLAYRRLEEFNQHRGLPPYELPPHDCDVHECNGSSDDPCVRVMQQHKSRFGLIAEEVFEIVPEAIHLDPDRQPEGIDYSMLITVLIATVQELTSRIAVLEDDEQFNELQGAA